MAILRWREETPFSDLLRMHQELDRLTQFFTGEERSKPLGKNIAGVFPAFNITADKEKIYIRAELPGINIKDLDINATGDTLSISGQRTIEPENQEISYHRRERQSGVFRRIINLTEEVVPDRAEAKYINGVLIITLAKPEKAKPKQISVKID